MTRPASSPGQADPKPVIELRRRGNAMAKLIPNYGYISDSILSVRIFTGGAAGAACALGKFGILSGAEAWYALPLLLFHRFMFEDDEWLNRVRHADMASIMPFSLTPPPKNAQLDSSGLRSIRDTVKAGLGEFT